MLGASKSKDNLALFAVTERRKTEDEIDALIKVVNRMKAYDKLILKSRKRDASVTRSESDTRESDARAPASEKRGQTAGSHPEFECVRHYTNVSAKNFGVETGFIPRFMHDEIQPGKSTTNSRPCRGLPISIPCSRKERFRSSSHIYHETARMLSESPDSRPIPSTRSPARTGNSQD